MHHRWSAALSGVLAVVALTGAATSASSTPHSADALLAAAQRRARAAHRPILVLFGATW